MSIAEVSGKQGFLAWLDLPIRTILTPGPPALPRRVPFDLGAKEIVAIPIERNETITIQTSLGAGWTHNKDKVPKYGPGGSDQAIPDQVEFVAVGSARLGSVVASFYPVAKPGADLHEWRRIFRSGQHLRVGDNKLHFANAYTGFLMFAMNDAFFYPHSLPNDGYNDNDGSVGVVMDIIRSP